MTKSFNLKIFSQITLLVLAFLILFKDTIGGLVAEWATNDNYSHGFLVPLLAGKMVWQKKNKLKQINIKPNKLGLSIFVCGMLIFIAGSISAEAFTTRSAIVITIAGLCTYMLGAQIAMEIAVPLLYLMFMIPLPAIIWNKIAFPLQLLTAKLTSNTIQLMGLPILREGNILYLHSTTLEVVDACSGIRSLTSMLALSAAFAYIVKVSNISKWILFLSAIPIAVVVNIIRLTTTSLLAIYAGPETAQGFLHYLSGMIVFMVALLMLWGLYSAILRAEQIIRSHKHI